LSLFHRSMFNNAAVDHMRQHRPLVIVSYKARRCIHRSFLPIINLKMPAYRYLYSPCQQCQGNVELPATSFNVALTSPELPGIRLERPVTIHPQYPHLLILPRFNSSSLYAQLVYLTTEQHSEVCLLDRSAWDTNL
jgi:hypothetical protein